ncbi:hypothetical protein L6452_05740 [Arctium lappa]|uniref:Uncharacterized protein n=1 Tax=Arctium lappa TaxID=4217 RepID=A0ACB9EIA7_ARCLA|nr:hypothetical protein L6452_05740 [Arctium lappa]
MVEFVSVVLIDAITTTLLVVRIMLRIKVACNMVALMDSIALISEIEGFGNQWSYIFCVESIARVKRLSLSGFLLYKLRMADQLFVQWPQLQKQYPRAHYVGRLM